MRTKPTAILLLGGPSDLARGAKEFCQKRFYLVHSSYYERQARQLSDRVYQSVQTHSVDYLFNFLSPVIVPKKILERIRRSAINFHPAPPEWPGVGSASYALYEGEKTFGVTAHIMEEKVDRGRIIRVQRFPIRKNDFCDTLFNRALAKTLQLFTFVLNDLATKNTLPTSRIQWKRRARTRAEFEQWMILHLNDPISEIRKKIRAVHHATFPGPFIEVEGYRFELLPRGKTE